MIDRLESFTTECAKPSIHFFGHTHGYSRGQSLDHQHLWVNVASAGGALDRWDEQPQADYPEFSVSQDAWGFVIVEVDTGSAPHFTLMRFSQGNSDRPLQNVESDTLTVWRRNTPPSTPTAVDCPQGLMQASPFADPDGHAHQASHWQTAPDCDRLLNDPDDIWRQRRNEYKDIDTQADDRLEDEPIPTEDVCWRVRYRDEGLVWSEWSAPSRCE